MKSLHIILLLLATIVHGKRSKGRIYTDEDFAYFDRFCFLSEIGNLYIDLRYPLMLHNENGVESLLLYYDTESQWHSAYQPNKSCEDRLALLDPTNNQQIRLTPYGYNPDRSVRCEITRPEGHSDDWVRCVGNRRFDTARARWWFLALSNCENRSGSIFIEYDITMTNGPPSDVWFYQFSADEFFILPVDVAFLVANVIMLFVVWAIGYQLNARKMLHQTIKLFMQSVTCEVFSLALMVGSYGSYASNGVGLPMLKLCGQLFRAAADTSFIILLLLIAKGYTITRGRLSNTSSWKLTFLICLYVILYMAMFIWQIKIFDPALVTFISESYPGYGIQALRLLSWVSYCISSFTTSKKYPKKREFYIILGLFMTLWFWMGPVTLYLANFLLDNWVREEVVNLVNCSVVLYGYIVLTVLTWPSMSNKNFPFHVRTTQIGDISSPADFPQNAYEMQSTSRDKETRERSVPDDEMTY